MRNQLEILQDIEAQLEAENRDSDFTELRDEVLGSVTGGELCARIGSWLLTKKQAGNWPEGRLMELSDEFVAFCNTNGMYPRPRAL